MFMEPGKNYRYKIVFSYDGTNFFGYAKQVNKRTVEEEIEKALSVIFKSNIKIYASGRTDKHVHALNQVADFVLDHKLVNKDKTLISLNKLLPNDIHIKSLTKVDINFSSRFDAKAKVYEYIINNKEYDPLKRDYELFDSRVKNIYLLKELSTLFIGTHNFQNFTSKETDEDNFIRTIYDISFKYKRNEGRIYILFKGNGFMRYEIRKIVGTLIEASLLKISESEIKYYLNSSNRSIINYTADPKGLYLKKVIYEKK